MSSRVISWEGKGGRCVGLTTLPPSCADCLEIWEPQLRGNPQDLSRPVMGLLYLLLLFFREISRLTLCRETVAVYSALWVVKQAVCIFGTKLLPSTDWLGSQISLQRFLNIVPMMKFILIYTGCPTRYQTRLTGGPLLRVATIRRTTDTHYAHIPFHFSHNERTPVQISSQYLHWC